MYGLYIHCYYYEFLYFDDVIMQANSNERRINGTAVATL